MAALRAAASRVMVVFDLDACCWNPEMFELWGGGAPFKQNSSAPNNTLTDARGTTVRMLADVATSFAELHRRKQAGEKIVVGIASRSDEPNWARECLRKFIVAPGVSMMDVVNDGCCEIHKGSKIHHLKELQKSAGEPVIPFERMCFFDDDPYNIRDVTTLGVHCFLTPQGVTKAIFDSGLAAAFGGAKNGDVFD